MTLTERERFIQHFSTISTMRIMMEQMKRITSNQPTFFSEEELALKGSEDVKAIRDTRCRNLEDEIISQLFEEMKEEALLGGGIIKGLLKD